MTTSKWICDRCGQLIEKPEDGVFQYLSTAEYPRKGRDVQIVHHVVASPLGGDRGCYFDEDAELVKDGMVMSDMRLDRLQGPDGLMIMLAMVSENFLPLNELLEAIQRIHIPGYEAARPYFEQAIGDDIIATNMPEGFYWQEQIQDVIAEYVEKD